MIECRKIKSLARDKNARHEVAATARDPKRRVVATGTSIGVLGGDAIEVTWENRRVG
jgi:hypothetical protein